MDISYVFSSLYMYQKQSLCQMYSLFLDHSFPREVLAFFENSRVIQEVVIERCMGEQPCLFWNTMLEKVGCTVDDIAFFVCGTGPGSYTGMRSAAAVVKAVSLVQKKPIIATSSLILLCPCTDGAYLLIKDAKVSGFYAQTVFVQGGIPLFSNPPKIVSEDGLEQYRRRELLLICEESDAVAMNVGALPVQLQSTVAARYAFEAFCRNDVILPENLPLLYLRQTQAEIQLTSSEVRNKSKNDSVSTDCSV